MAKAKRCSLAGLDTGYAFGSVAFGLSAAHHLPTVRASVVPREPDLSRDDWNTPQCVHPHRSEQGDHSIDDVSSEPRCRWLVMSKRGLYELCGRAISASMEWCAPHQVISDGYALARAHNLSPGLGLDRLVFTDSGPYIRPTVDPPGEPSTGNGDG